jgi:EAL domain-containing protein (putative c-di-GMP-specific phosphodiesterase class I)
MDETASPSSARERRSPTPAAARKREAIRRLKQAMAEERFVLHYQPIVGARDGAITGVEALLRWKDGAPETEDLARLVRLAERSPVIFRLQDWTLREACLAAAAWPDPGRAGFRVNVNVSARVLPRSRLVGRLRRQLRSAGLPAGALALEITETSSMEEFAAVAEQLDQMIAMGVELWLDDFGTGHSSLQWLSHLPIHGVKIAGTFVERLGEERCRVIVTRVLEMAHDLGLRVAAEGVETDEQRGFLVERGCDLLQGFLFHAPVSAEALPGLLARAASGQERS